MGFSVLQDYNKIDFDVSDVYEDSRTGEVKFLSADNCRKGKYEF